jgi:hypothetical protein
LRFVAKVRGRSADATAEQQRDHAFCLFVVALRATDDAYRSDHARAYVCWVDRGICLSPLRFDSLDDAVWYRAALFEVIRQSRWF